MGQKINPIIFRLGINKKWDTEFFEKKKDELPLYIFKDLEIKSYIERLLETHGILLHDYKHSYNNSTLTFYISYFVSSEFNKSKSSNILLSTKTGVTKKVNFDTKQIEKILDIDSKVNNSLHFDVAHRCYQLRKYLQAANKTKELLTQNKLIKQLENSISKTTVLNQLFKVLSLFTGNQFDIKINFCCLNKDLNFLRLAQKKNFILLRRFRTTPFLKEGIELLFYFVHSNNSASLLAKFVASQVQKSKRHKFFLSFLKRVLTILLGSTFSKVKGVKIGIKGRLNGVPRAKSKILTIGDVPVQTISEKIDYFQTSVQNSNGSYGIKVWSVEK